MLVLSRKAGESVLIGDQIDITILSIEPGGQVNIGISAPKDILILRRELQQATQANQDAATLSSPSLVSELQAAFFHETHTKQDTTDTE